jgi:hypothetical protein
MKNVKQFSSSKYDRDQIIMNNPHRSTNQDQMATAGSCFLFVYVWIGLFGLLYLMFRSGFFGFNLGGWLVTGAVCLFFATPVLPGVVTRFVIQPLFRNLLGREMISTAGCLTAIAIMVLSILGIVFFLTRNLRVSFYIFLGSPILAGLLSFIISLLGRSGSGSSLFSKHRWAGIFRR